MPVKLDRVLCWIAMLIEKIKQLKDSLFLLKIYELRRNPLNINEKKTKYTYS